MQLIGRSVFKAKHCHLRAAFLGLISSNTVNCLQSVWNFGLSGRRKLDRESKAR